MPQISASLDHPTINAISELATENKPMAVSFSTMVKTLLCTHPQVVTQIKQSSKKSKK